jgi:hypothetical protein
MRAISHWAKANPRKTWLFITLGHLLTAALCLRIGGVLFALGVTFPSMVLYAAAALAIVGANWYPSRRSFANSAVFHARRLRFDALLLFAGVLATVSVGNLLTREAEKIMHAPPAPALSQSEGIWVSARAVALKAEPSEVRRNLVARFVQKSLHARYLKDKFEERRKGVVGYLILMVLLVLVLEIILAYASCAIICSGAEVLGVLLFVGGMTGLAFGVIAVLRKLLPEKEAWERVLMALAIILLPIAILAFIAAA